MWQLLGCLSEQNVIFQGDFKHFLPIQDNFEAGEPACDLETSSWALKTLLRISFTAGLPISYTFDYVKTFAVGVRFQIRDKFWNPQPKLHRAIYLEFFVKHQNMLVWLVAALCGVFQENLGTILALQLKIIFYWVVTITHALLT